MTGKDDKERLSHTEGSVAGRSTVPPVEEAQLEVEAVAPQPEHVREAADRQRGPIHTVLYWIGVVEQAAGGLFVLAIFALVLLQVAQRYLPVAGRVWTGELARFSLVWCTMVLLGYLMARDKHITLHLIDYVLPARATEVVRVISHLVVALCCLAFLYEAYHLISEQSGQVSPAARIPLTWVYIVPFIGFALTVLSAIVSVVNGRADDSTT